MKTWSDSCPAKINLRLAVTGQRSDGYHHLISLVAQISLADELAFEWSPLSDGESLQVTGEALSTDENNLVLRALRAFRSAAPFAGHITARLTKRIPVGAGLGGGSSDAAGTLRGMQAMWGSPLDPETFSRIAVELGADVPLFLAPSPAVIRGIGEVIEPMPAWHDTLAEWRVAVFRPFFGISTPWAYQQLAKAAGYSDAVLENQRYGTWKRNGLEVHSVPGNDFRRVVDLRYPTIPVLLEAVNSLAGVRAEMTGSGSACFALCRTREAVEAVHIQVVRAWGTNAFWTDARFL